MVKFPILMVNGGVALVPSQKSGFEKLFGSFSAPDRLHLKSPAQERFRTTAIIDYEGKYYEVIPGKLNRPWLARFARIWDLTSMDCRLSEGRTLTVGELQQMAKAWKNQYARLFRKFLVKQDPNAVFDSTLFRQAWEHSYINLPEEEWGEDAFS